MTHIILCGGSGTRLWPISRTLMPKQFLKLFNQTSLFQLCMKRNSACCSRRIIVSNAENYFIALDQVQELHEDKDTLFLLEPFGRNTAPAIALACLALDPDTVVLVTPSDHLIKNEKSYEKVVLRAKELALEGHIVTFGIQAQYPETGYGYIEAIGEDVKAFHEKPDEEVAAAYVKAGNFYWNSGMFCFRAGVYLDELKKYAPEVYAASLHAYETSKKDFFIRITDEAMSEIPDESIDYAVMEKSNRVKMIPSDIDWNDVGSFDALDQEYDKDEYGNTLCKHLYALHAENNFVYSNNKTVALGGVNDLVVAVTNDVVLITKKGTTQAIKELVSFVKQNEPDLTVTDRTTHRPWGTFTILEEQHGYKIKRIEVKPGCRLSLQKHMHRNEHWIIISGTATVTVGTTKKILRTNESTYIKMGEVHRLENEGKIPVVLIEAQVGAYTGEDDIIRIEDDFNRA